MREKILTYFAEMDCVGVGIAILSELHTSVKSLEGRYGCSKQRPELFQEVDYAISRVRDSFADIYEIMNEHPMPQ